MSTIHYLRRETDHMAKRTEVKLIDDLDGGPADETVHFTVDGKGYEIDLSAANAETLRKVLTPYVEAGRKAATRTSLLATTRRPKSDPAQLAAIRDWARQNGYEISNRGRIPHEIQIRFDHAHQS